MFLRKSIIVETRCLAKLLRSSRSVQRRCYSAAVVKSIYENTEIPKQTLPQFVWSRSSQWEDLPALTCGISGRSYSFGLARMLTDTFARSLVNNLPLEFGDKIGLLMPNLPEYLIAIHGCINAGFVPTFANPLYTAEEIARQFLDANVRCIITISQLLDNALTVSAALKDYTFTINVGGPNDHERKVLGLEEFLKVDTSDVELPKVNPGDVACLPYSSGTTGLPKGVALTHENLIANVVQSSHKKISDPPSATCIEDQEVVFSVLPFFHIYGFNGILNFCVHHGVHIVTMPRFAPGDYLACLEKYQPSSIFAVPALILFLASHPDVKPVHLQSLKRVICAAAPIAPNVIQKFRKRVNRAEFIFQQGYGMTEMSPVALFTPMDIGLSKDGSVGRLLPSTEAKLVDLASGKELTGPNQSGELLIRGPQIMKGYLNNPTATRETIDPDGWLHTGDVAHYDEDGYFYIVDRTKELIKVKGNQVSPTELEAILIEIPGIVDCAVVGIQDNVAGELPRAFIVKAAGSEVTAQAIKSLVDPKVAPYKRLEGGVKFIEAIPRNPSGKIMRHVLKALNV